MLFVLGDSQIRALRDGFAAFSDEERAEYHKKFGAIKFAQIETAENLRHAFFEMRSTGIHFLGKAGAIFEQVVGNERPFIAHGDGRKFLFSAGFFLLDLCWSPMWQSFTIDGSVSDKDYLSQAAFADIILTANATILEFYQAAQALKVQFAVLAAAPVSRRAIARPSAQKLGIAEILALDKRAKFEFSKKLDDIGIQRITLPAEILEDGLLREELCAVQKRFDVHGNERYGQLLFRHAVQRCDTQFSAAR